LAKIIIGIHGLGNKPIFDLLSQWWRSSICEGLNHVTKPHKYLKFQMVGWSDLIHSKPEDFSLTETENPLFVSEPYEPAITWSEPKNDTRRKRIQKFLEEQLERILINTDGTVNFASITDKIVQRYFRDLDIYYSGQCINGSNILIRDAIRERLYKVLKKYQGHSIMIIAHSMGSIISYDVLKNNIDDISIDTFVTIGSPLGLPIITGKIIKEQGGVSMLTVPDNIKKNWFNFSDLEDKVAINYDLSDDYAPSQSGIKITDFEIYNNYEINNMRNPHKVYGYLRTPLLSEKIDEFLMAGKNRINIWLTRKLNEFFK
jgi:PGAP1-like protein